MFRKKLTATAIAGCLSVLAITAVAVSASKIVGTKQDDSLAGTSGADRIVGLSGNDTIDGSAGNDILIGGPGNDQIAGGAGSDRLYAGAGSDTLFGDAGDDRIFAKAIHKDGGSDNVDAGDGNDVVNVRDGVLDTVVCGEGTDTVLADSRDSVNADCEQVYVGEPKPTKSSSGEAEKCIPARNIESIIDDSGSMRGTDKYRLRLAALELLINKPSNERKTLGSVEFGSSAASIFGPTQIAEDKLALLKRLDESILGDDGMTNYNDAFKLALKENPASDAVIFLTDGKHNQGIYKDLHRGASKTYVIGFSSSSSGEPLLRKIASETGGEYYGDVTTDNLQAVFNEIDSHLNCEGKPDQIEDTFSDDEESGQNTRSQQMEIKEGRSNANLVVTWPDPSKSMKVSSMRIERHGKVVASSNPALPSIRKLDINSVSGLTYQAIGIKNLVPGKLRYTLKLKKNKKREVRNPYTNSGRSKPGLGGAVPISATNVTTQLSQTRGSKQKSGRAGKKKGTRQRTKEVK